MSRNLKWALSTRPYKKFTQENLEKPFKRSETRHCQFQNAASKYGIPKNTLHLKSQEKHTMSVGRATVFSAEEEEQFVAHIVAVSNYGLICAAS